MNQNKGLIPVIVCSCIVAVVYLAVVFAVPFLWTPSYWVAFWFGWASILVAILANLYAVRASAKASGVVYRSSLSAVSIAYLIVATVVTFVFMALGFVPIWLVVLVQVLLMAICIAVLFGLASAVSHIEDGEAATRYETAFIKNMRMQSEAFEAVAATPESKMAVKRIVEAFRYADPVANPATGAVDQEIAGLMGALQSALQAQDDEACAVLCARIDSAIKQRAAIAIATR